MNRKNDVAQSESGLSLDHQEQLLSLFHESNKQTQLLHNQMQSQTRFNRLILLIVFISIAIIFFFAVQIITEKKKPDSGASIKDVTLFYEKLRDKYDDQLGKIQSDFDKKTAQMNAENQKDKDLFFKEVEKYYKNIITTMEKARSESDQLMQKYKKQLTDYETRVFIQQKQIKSITTQIAAFENEHNALLEKYKKLQKENQNLTELNKDLRKKLYPYLDTADVMELEKKRNNDN
ncbi:hypothetical protein [Candidatus Uabimicrobium amorphum]|uniref:Uncharacterized protein n=1 Tax=Uabimicrobium amorphum TaxID=2596890 RepID=A0A5S9IQ57_UABAM|nr:hypothetical protein [Candidatus Uabimicrobium amorphum]BBM85110.1 hypothetical protein UABAM_03473 [Candidatus Uabimicrobium amorphum]